MSLKREIDSPIIDFPPVKRVKSVGVQKRPGEECLLFPSVKEEIEESPNSRGMSTESNISVDKSFHRGGHLPSSNGIKLDLKDNCKSGGRSVTSEKSEDTPQDSGARGTLPGTSTQTYTEPNDTVCDFCVNQRVSALKTCLTCSCNFCEIHVRHHYTIPALQKHVLAEVSGVGGHKDQDQRSHIGTVATPRTGRVSETARLSPKYSKKNKSGLSDLEMKEKRIKKLEKKNRKLKNISKIKSNLEKEVIQLKREKDALSKENTKLKQEASSGSLLTNKNMCMQQCTGWACLQKERGSGRNQGEGDDCAQSGDEEGFKEDDSQLEDGGKGFEDDSRSKDEEDDELEEGDWREEEYDYDDEDENDDGLDEESSQDESKDFFSEVERDDDEYNDDDDNDDNEGDWLEWENDYDDDEDRGSYDEDDDYDYDEFA